MAGYHKTSPERLLPPFLLLFLHVQGASAQDDGSLPGTWLWVVVGCVVGVVVIAIVGVICCLVRRPSNKYKSKRQFTDEPYSSLPKERRKKKKHGYFAGPLPPPVVWATNPELFSNVSQPPHAVYGKAPPGPHRLEDGHYVSDPVIYAREPFFRRTVRRVLKSLPAVFQVKRFDAKNLPGSVHASSTSKEVEERGQITEVAPETIRGPVHHEAAEQSVSHDRSDDISANSSEHTATAFCNYVSPNVGTQTDDVDSYVARARSNYSTLEDANGTGTQKTDSGYGSNARLTSLSDWSLGGKVPRPVVRSQSVLDKTNQLKRSSGSGKKNVKRASSFQAQSSEKSQLQSYRPTIIREVEGSILSLSDAQSNVTNSSKKRQSRKEKNREKEESPQSMIDHNQFILRSSTDLSSPTGQTGEATYSLPNKVKRHSHEKKKDLESPSSPIPPPLPPPLRQKEGCINRGYDGSDEDVSDSRQVTVEAVVEKTNLNTPFTRPDREMSYSVKGKRVADDAFRFLDEFDDTMSFGDELEAR